VEPVVARGEANLLSWSRRSRDFADGVIAESLGVGGIDIVQDPGETVVSLSHDARRGGSGCPLWNTSPRSGQDEERSKCKIDMVTTRHIRTTPSHRFPQSQTHYVALGDYREKQTVWQ
jgi:hypothetical protein